MSKTQKIRDTLATLAAGEVMPTNQLQEKTGIEQLAVAIHCMLKSGEVIATGNRGEKCYRLNAKYTPKRGIDKTLPIKRRPKKTRKPARRAQPRTTLRDIAERVAATPPLSRLAVQQLIAASRLLRTTVTTNVDGLENDPLLTGALQNAERAEAMAEAA